MPQAPRTETDDVAAALDAFRLEDSASHLLRRAHFRAENLFAARLAPFGLTPRQKAVLIVVHQHPGAALNEIADHVVLDRQTTADITTRLVSRGLLERRRSDHDRRAYALWLTEAGSGLLREVMPLDAAVETEILAALPAEHRASFMTLLQLMTTNGSDAVTQREVPG